MVGGTVIEVVPEAGRVWLNVRDIYHPNDTCAVYVERNPQSVLITPGDALWWQGGFCYWTPQANRAEGCEHREHATCLQKAGVDYDIPVPRVSYSGVGRPEGHDIFDHDTISA